MLKKWSLVGDCLVFRQLVLISGLLFCSVTQGQSSPVAGIMRGPASYIPDDDLIVKPVQNELSFYQQYVASDRSQEVVATRNQLRIWNENQAFADQYGLDSSLAGSSFFVPTPEEKWEYFKDRYLRYLRRRGEQPLKDMPKGWYQEFRASNEVDTIDEIEGRFDKTQKGTSTGRALPKSMQATEVNVWKEYKFVFQPRLDQGLVIVGVRSPSFSARAWVGVNGETEFNVQQNVDTIGFRAMVNYYARTGKYFISLDQRIMPHLYARLTANREPGNITNAVQNLRQLGSQRDEQLMLLYATQF
jgi:hypothetical protein